MKKGLWKAICEECWERHIPSTVKPTYVTIEMLDFTPSFGACMLCDNCFCLTFYVEEDFEDLLPFKRGCEKCQGETDHLLFYKKIVCMQECLQCGHQSKYQEKRKSVT